MTHFIPARRIPAFAIFAAALSLAGPMSVSGTIVISGTTEISANTTWNDNVVVQPGGTLRVRSTLPNTGTTLTVTGSIDNYGTIELENLSPSYTTTLTVNTLLTVLTNHPGGDIRSGGANNSTFINTRDIVNNGLIRSQAPDGQLTLNVTTKLLNNPGGILAAQGRYLRMLSFSGIPRLETTGLIQAGAGATFIVTGNATLHYTGGSIEGAGELSVAGGGIPHTFWKNPDIASLKLSSLTTTLPEPIETSITQFSANDVNLTVPEIHWEIGGTSTITSSAIQGDIIIGSDYALDVYDTTVNGDVTVEGAINVLSPAVINGHLHTMPGSHSLFRTASLNTIWTVRDGITNHGEIQLSATTANKTGTLKLTEGPLVNEADGLFWVFSTVQAPFRLEGQVTNYGTMSIRKALTLAYSGPADLVNAGELNMSAELALDLAAAGVLRNTGTIQIDWPVALRVNTGRVVNGPDGVLRGTGSVITEVLSLLNQGRIRPGTSPGRMRISGDLTCEETSRIEIELGGTTWGSQHDRLEIFGDGTLAGTLSVSAINGFTPAPDDLFAVVTWNSHSGTFSSLEGLDLTPAIHVIPDPAGPDFGATGMTLRAVPAGISDVQDVPDSRIERTGFLPSIWPAPARRPFAFRIGLRAGGPIDVSVFTIDGRRVGTLLNGEMAPGVHEMNWTGLNASGSQLAGGVYFVRLSSASSADVKRVVWAP